MKYIVEVNAKWLVSVEAGSICDAERKLLDYNGVWGAMAYDRDMMKTDTFAGAVQGCEMVSMNELVTMKNDLMDKKKTVIEAKIKREDANAEVERLRKLLQDAESVLNNAQKEAQQAEWGYSKALDLMGRERR